MPQQCLRRRSPPVSGTTLRDFDFRRITDYFRRLRQQNIPDENDQQGWTALPANTEFFVEDGIGVGGLLLFGLNPNRHLPHAGITAVAFPGNQKDYAVRERLSIRGPLTPLFDNGRLRENGLVEQAVEFINRNSPPGVRFEQELTVAIHLNQRVRFAPVDIKVPQLNMGAIWVFGATSFALVWCII